MAWDSEGEKGNKMKKKKERTTDFDGINDTNPDRTNHNLDISYYKRPVTNNNHTINFKSKKRTLVWQEAHPRVGEDTKLNQVSPSMHVFFFF